MCDQTDFVETEEQKQIPLWVCWLAFALPLMAYVFMAAAASGKDFPALVVVAFSFIGALAPAILFYAIVQNIFPETFDALVRWAEHRAARICFRIRCIYERHTLNLP